MIQLEAKGRRVAGKPHIKLLVGAVGLVVEMIVEKILHIPETELEAAGDCALGQRGGRVDDNRDKDEKEDNRDNQGDGRLTARHEKSFPKGPGEDAQDGYSLRIAPVYRNGSSGQKRGCPFAAPCYRWSSRTELL